MHVAMLLAYRIFCRIRGALKKVVLRVPPKSGDGTFFQTGKGLLSLNPCNRRIELPPRRVPFKWGGLVLILGLLVRCIYSLL